MSDWLDNAFDATKAIRRCAYKLESLSMSLYDVGNSHLAERLDTISRDLQESSDTVHKAAGQARTELLHSAQSGAFNMLSVALVMAEREKEKDR